MKKINICVILAATILCQYYAFGMEEKINITKEDTSELKKDSNESELRPHRQIDVKVEEDEDYNSITFNELDSTVLALGIKKDRSSFRLICYNALNGDIIEKFENKDYFIAVPSGTTKLGFVILLVDKKFIDVDALEEYQEKNKSIKSFIGYPLLAGTQPLYTYNLKTKELRKIDYTMQESEIVFAIPGINSQTAECKAISIYNYRRQQGSVILIDKDNKVVHTFKNAYQFNLVSVSPDGERVLLGREFKVDDWNYFIELYDISDKKNPKKIKEYDETQRRHDNPRYWFSQVKNEFCNGKEICDRNGGVKETLTKDMEVIGFSSQDFCLRDKQKKEIFLYERDKPKEGYKVWHKKYSSRLRMSGTGTKDIAIYHSFPVSFEENNTIYFYKINNKDSGYFSNCTIH